MFFIKFKKFVEIGSETYLKTFFFDGFPFFVDTLWHFRLLKSSFILLSACLLLIGSWQVDHYGPVDTHLQHQAISYFYKPHLECSVRLDNSTFQETMESDAVNLHKLIFAFSIILRKYSQQTINRLVCYILFPIKSLQELDTIW